MSAPNQLELTNLEGSEDDLLLLTNTIPDTIHATSSFTENHASIDPDLLQLQELGNQIQEFPSHETSNPPLHASYALGIDPGVLSLPSITPSHHDVLYGRGASVNAHLGNKRFRSWCLSRKIKFDSGNHAIKRQIATEIVEAVRNLQPPGRFLKRLAGKGPWVELNDERAVVKACQVMRDIDRADRLCGKRQRIESSQNKEMSHHAEDGMIVPKEHDVLAGRGAFANYHLGNRRFRTLAMERKPQFDSGNYADKRALAAEVVRMIRSLDPPGRFLMRAKDIPNKKMPPRGLEGYWIEIGDERAVHKACQVMRDCNRLDRMDPERGVMLPFNDKEGIGIEEDENIMLNTSDYEKSEILSNDALGIAARAAEVVDHTIETAEISKHVHL